MLLAELRGLIEQARQHVAQTANSTLTMLHWHMGQRIHREILNQQRASYGEEILPTLPAKLVREYGKGFAEKSLRRMVQFAEVFPDENIVATIEMESFRRMPPSEKSAAERRPFTKFRTWHTMPTPDSSLESAAMITRNVVLTSHQSSLVERLVASGRYQNASEVLRDGLRLIESREADDKARLKALRDAVRVGIADMDAGRYRSFDTTSELRSHLSGITKRVLAEKAASARAK